MAGSFEVKDHDPVDSISHPTRRKVSITLAIDMDAFWERLSSAYQRDKRGVSTDFNRPAATPWLLEGDERLPPPSDPSSRKEYIQKLMKKDPAILELDKPVELREELEEKSTDLSASEAALKQIESLPANSHFNLLTQAGLRSYSPDLIYSLLSPLFGSDLSENYNFRVNTSPGVESAMAVGFSYKPQLLKESGVESGNYEFKILAEGKGFSVPSCPGKVFLGHMETTVVFDKDHVLIPGQKVTVNIEVPIPTGGPYDALMEAMIEEGFYASGAFDQLGTFDVSVHVDEVLSFSQEGITSDPTKMMEFFDEFQKRPEIIRAKTVNSLVQSSMISEGKIFSSKIFTEKFITTWTNASAKQRLDLEADYIRRSTAPGDALFVDENSGKKKMDETIRSYIPSVTVIEASIRCASGGDDAHQRREIFRDVFIEAYKQASPEEQFAYQWRYRMLLADPTSSLHELMTEDASLSAHEVGGVPVGHTAVEIDRFFDEEVKRAREEKEKEIRLKANAKVKAEALTQFSSLQKTLVNDLLSEAVGKKPLVVSLPKAAVVKESSVPQLPAVNSLIAKREKLELAKQTSKFMLCCSFVVVAGFLGGPIAAGVALIISLIMFGAANYFKNERADRRRISRTPATALVVGQRSKPAVPALSRDADFSSEAK